LRPWRTTGRQLGKCNGSQMEPQLDRHYRAGTVAESSAITHSSENGSIDSRNMSTNNGLRSLTFDISWRPFLLSTLLILAASAVASCTSGDVDLSAPAHAASQSIVQVVTDKGDDSFSYGSGVRVDAGIITNAHVVAGARSVALLMPSSRTIPATITATDASHDLALLRADVQLPSIPIAQARGQPEGEPVLALGFPLPSELGPGGKVTITKGVLSRIADDPQRGPLVQTDASLNPGNSGGALINSSGQLIGITTGQLTPKNGQGLNFAIASETVLSFVSRTQAASPGVSAGTTVTASGPTSTTAPLSRRKGTSSRCGCPLPGGIGPAVG
jgi:S1-C subfamily serine protease